MRVLWITGLLVNTAGELFYNQSSNGLWVDAELSGFSRNPDPDIQLFIATCGKTDVIMRAEKDGINYYVLPDRCAYNYKPGKKSNITAVRSMLSEVCPDIVHFWGSESPFSLDIAECLTEAQHSVLYIQGVMRSISRYLKAGMTEKEILSTYTLFDFIAKCGIYELIRRYKKTERNESILIKKAGCIIGENQWSKAFYSAINPKIKFYPCPIHINTSFYQVHWDRTKAEPHTILCNSSNYSLKGLHMLLMALSLVKKRYPDVMLYVPGNNNARRSGFKNLIKRSGYVRYIRKILTKNNLWDSVHFLGYLSASEMAERLVKTQVYTMTSAIENHSASLKEAMLVGVPCISSIVGGISEYAHHGVNALLYRFEDYEVLANHICNLFEDTTLADRLSVQARSDMIALHIDCDIHAQLVGIYRDINKVS